MSQNVLVFSIALNGYQWLYRDCLASHKAYAQKNGYRHCTVSKPITTSLGVECCWLKLTLMLEALNTGYDLVLFVDADAYINHVAPSLEQVVQSNKYLYMAKSYSERFNSGVILVKNSTVIQTWLQSVISSRNEPISQENDVGWGENGHIIQHAKGFRFLSTLDRRWNNTYDPNLKDYIRHFSFGPLRQNVFLNVTHKILSRLSRLYTKMGDRFLVKTHFPARENALTDLTKKVIVNYSCFIRL
ncbi:hypothetical protein [Paraglaciecola sp.]|uniref:hypothetical protein n=1 Tax=Paraglaciecola sp. TaxID=1920173 RepID=UPI003EFA00C6